MPRAVKHIPFALAVMAALLQLIPTAFCQGNATVALTQMSQAVSGGLPILKIAFAGTATFHAGTTVDSGTVSLVADTTGLVTTQLSLAKLGSRMEQVSAGPLSACSWAGADGVSHDANGLNCWRPAAWFFPPISLQLTSLLPGVGVSDLGTGTVGTGTYRHLQSQLVLSAFDTAMAKQIMQESTVDLGLDPSTMLPAVMTYTVRTDSGAAVFVPIQARYSNYQKVNGVQVPFHIERYINGSLQYSIDLTSAQIN